MATKRDYYEVLGVSKNATDDELKKAYRKLKNDCLPSWQRRKRLRSEKREIHRHFHGPVSFGGACDGDAFGGYRSFRS